MLDGTKKPCLTTTTADSREPTGNLTPIERAEIIMARTRATVERAQAVMDRSFEMMALTQEVVARTHETLWRIRRSNRDGS